MFDDTSSFQEQKISMSNFREWANSAASDYMGGGDDPTVSLCKIAQQENLVPHQIHTLAAEINKTLHQKKYASEQNKYHAADFPLANAREAVSKLQSDGGEVKLAMELESPRFTDQMPDAYAMFGVKPEGEIDKTASIRYELRGSIEKTALLKDKLGDSLRLGAMEADALELQFIKTARQHVLANSMCSDDRMQRLGELNHFFKEGGLQKRAQKPLAKLAYVLGREGLLEKNCASKVFDFWMDKKADQEAPEEWISPLLKARVVNGQNPLYITLKTFDDKCNALDLYKDRYQLVDDRLKIMSQKVRAL